MIAWEVRRCPPVPPGLVGVTPAGAGIGHLAPGGPDQAVRLFFPRQGQRELRTIRLHGDSPMTSWVRRVQPGDPAGTARHLVNDGGVPKRNVGVYGYWRLGRSAPG
ncbi:SIP domain-containing protein [Streptomyces goshikiensis]|uniref:hypothetical protein n=1 Tax=Streptomyces goshikiensis TaxID=1942 RepID=UPI0036922474